MQETRALVMDAPPGRSGMSLVQEENSLLQSLTEEVRLVLLCTRPASCGDAAGSIEFLLARHDVDWEHVLHLARFHEVAPLVYRALRDLSDDLAPAEVKARLQKEFHRIGLITRLQTAALADLLRAFDERHIPLLVFKGLALGEEAYGNAVWRKSGDIDLLIRKSDFDEAKKVLESFGCRTRLTVREENEQLKRQNQLTFRGDRCDVDLHCSLQQRSFLKISYAANFDEEPVWSRRRQIWVGDVAVPGLALEDLFCLLCVHGAKHGWFRVYMIADIAALAASGRLDWNTVFDLAHRLNVERIVLLSLSLAQQLFDIDLPAHIRALLSTDVALQGLCERTVRMLFDAPAKSNPFQFHAIQLALFDNLFEKAGYLLVVGLEFVRRKLAERTGSARHILF